MNITHFEISEKFILFRRAYLQQTIFHMQHHVLLLFKHHAEICQCFLKALPSHVEAKHNTFY